MAESQPPSKEKLLQPASRHVPPGWTEDWSKVTPVKPSVGLDEEWISQFPLSTKGRHIITKKGERFKLIGTNWYGASDTGHIVGGLDTQSLEVICRTVRDLGHTVVRLPFSNEMLRSKIATGSIDYKKNPQLRKLKSPLEVFDEVIHCLGKNNVAVIINNHTTYGEFCGPPSSNSLWFDPLGPFSEEQWIADWLMIAKRYSRCPYVIGYDLRNEIRPRLSLWPSWGRGRSSGLRGRRDWAAAAATASERLLEVNPEALIVVERIVWPQRGLNDYAANPGPLLPRFAGRLVLGVHHYSWSGPGRFVPRWSIPSGTLTCFVDTIRGLGLITKTNYGDMSYNKLKQQIASEWGNILEADRCPVWVSEFGADISNPEEMSWLRNFVKVLSDYDADWAYWPLNVGPKPTCGGDEAYGMLRPDWTQKKSPDERLQLLESIGLCSRKEMAIGRMDSIDSPPRRRPPMSKEKSAQNMRALYGCKDPLFGVKHVPDVREYFLGRRSGLRSSRSTPALALVKDSDLSKFRSPNSMSMPNFHNAFGLSVAAEREQSLDMLPPYFKV